MPPPNPLGPRQTSSRGTAVPTLNTVPMPQRTNSLRLEREPSRRGQVTPVQQAPQQPPPPPEERYVVYLRLPFERNGFVDPPQVDWDTSKERYLWKVLSKGSRNAALDWKALAAHLQVSKAFLLQQAAWLYEQELSQIQAQMRRVGTGTLGLNTNLGAPTSPAVYSPTTAGLGGVAMVRTGTEPRTTSSLSVRSGTTPTPTVPNTPTTGIRPTAQPMSRTASSSTTRAAPTPQTQPPVHRFSNPLAASTHATPPRIESPIASEDDSMEDESVTSSEGEDSSELIRKYPSFLKKHSSDSDADTDLEDMQPAFLPFASVSQHMDSSDVMTGTVTLPARRVSGTGAKDKGKEREFPRKEEERSDGESSAGEETIVNESLKPVVRKSVAGSPRRRNLVDSGGPSSPSMGSSFSDLSDTSITQSAMEEAYLSTMGHGGMASRMSSLSQAVKSKYFHSRH